MLCLLSFNKYLKHNQRYPLKVRPLVVQRTLVKTRLDLVEQAGMMLSQQLLGQMKKQRHLPSNLLKHWHLQLLLLRVERAASNKLKYMIELSETSKGAIK